jgi:OmpA-OmpF porin, OOP family
MRRGIELALLAGVAGVVMLPGCATKKYVAKTVDPVQQKLDQVQKQADTTQKQLEATEPKISAAQEKADSADNRAGEAMGRADAVGKKTDQVATDLTSTRNEFNDRLGNLDNYKSVGDITVLFKFNSDKLTDEAKQQLDQAVQGNVGNLKRYFVAIQGFTDKVGPADYNLELSRRRAIAVQNYLIGQHNVPVFRVQIVGLGKDKPVNDQKTRDDRAKNRRVEVQVYSADANAAGGQGSSSPQ